MISNTNTTMKKIDPIKRFWIEHHKRVKISFEITADKDVPLEKIKEVVLSRVKDLLPLRIVVDTIK